MDSTNQHIRLQLILFVLTMLMLVQFDFLQDNMVKMDLYYQLLYAHNNLEQVEAIRNSVVSSSQKKEVYQNFAIEANRIDNSCQEEAKFDTVANKDKSNVLGAFRMWNALDNSDQICKDARQKLNHLFYEMNDFILTEHVQFTILEKHYSPDSSQCLVFFDTNWVHDLCDGSVEDIQQNGISIPHDGSYFYPRNTQDSIHLFYKGHNYYQPDKISYSFTKN